MNNYKILILDIETSPWEALCYGNSYEPIVVKINTFTQILSMAYRWYGDSKTHYLAQNKTKGYKKGKINDKELLVEISKIVNDADFIVGHNSDNFDIKIIKERIMYHRLPALSGFQSLDTKKLIKGIAKLPNNKLQTTTQFLGNGGKLEHNGTDLFIGCMNGDEKSWNTNEKYNKQDVDITYKDLEDMLPYVKLPNSFNRFNGEVKCSNPICNSINMHVNKTRRVSGGWKRQYICQDCGRYTTDNKLYKERP